MLDEAQPRVYFVPFRVLLRGAPGQPGEQSEACV
jgi:hypothetical protein